MGKTENLGRVVRKLVNANLGLKVNQSVNFSCIKMLLTVYVCRSFRSLKPKTERQTILIENVTEKLQNRNQHSR